jgi:hypothetical protein
MRLPQFTLPPRIRQRLAPVAPSAPSVPSAAIMRALLAMPLAASAQSTGADAGSTLWSAFKAVLYGPWGLGIYMFLERGFLHAMAVMAAGGLIFFVPLIVVSMRNAAQAMGGAG